MPAGPFKPVPMEKSMIRCPVERSSNERTARRPIVVARVLEKKEWEWLSLGCGASRDGVRWAMRSDEFMRVRHHGSFMKSAVCSCGRVMMAQGFLIIVRVTLGAQSLPRSGGILEPRCLLLVIVGLLSDRLIVSATGASAEESH